MTGPKVRTIRWGAEPEFFGPRHDFRERVLFESLRGWKPEDGWLVDAAAGLGSFSRKLAENGFRVVALDRSLESLIEHRRISRLRGLERATLPVLGDVTALPFRTGSLAGAVTAETIEHLDDDRAAAMEFSRVVALGGGLAVSTPADPAQWSHWDEWAEHRRRYRRDELVSLFEEAGFGVSACRSFGFPLVRLYDALFLRRLIRRRADTAAVEARSPIVAFARRAGKSRLLVRLATAVFGLDRLFDWARLGVGWTLTARRRTQGS